MVGMSKARAENRPLPKRFYTEVSLVEEAGGFALLLDGKRVKTPAKKALLIPGAELAERIAEEWRAQVTFIDTDTMPLTRLLHILLDRIELDRLALLEQICAFGETDLLCYRDTEKELAARQVAAFDPILKWAHTTYHLPFESTEGVMPISQPTASLAKLFHIFEAATDRELTALAMLVPMLGSALMTLALWKGFITLEQALKAARLDEDFQAERWGEDAELAAAWANKRRDIRAAAFFLTGK